MVKKTLFKKTVAASMAAVLACGMIACGTKDAGEEKNPTETSGTENNNSEEPESPYPLLKDEKGNVYDLGGMEVIIRDWWSSGDEPEPQNAYEEARKEYLDWIQDTYNFTIKMQAIGDWSSAPGDFVNYASTGGDENYVFTVWQGTSRTASMTWPSTSIWASTMSSSPTSTTQTPRSSPPPTAPPPRASTESSRASCASWRRTDSRVFPQQNRALAARFSFCARSQHRTEIVVLDKTGKI